MEYPKFSTISSIYELKLGTLELRNIQPTSRVKKKKSNKFYTYFISYDKIHMYFIKITIYINFIYKNEYIFTNV